MTVTQIDGARQIRFTAALDLQTQKIINVVDPTADQEAATKGYVDAQVAGGGIIDYKDSVFLASTADGTLAGDYENGDTIDGTLLSTGDRILIKNQSTASENGIYTVNASGPPTRAGDADADAEVTAGMQVWVEAGTANADTGWIITTNGTITVDTTGIAFARIGGAGDSHLADMTAGQGLSQTTDLIDVELTASAGLEFTGAAPSGTLGINLDTNSGLALGAGGISIGDGSGLVASSGVLAVDLEANGAGAGGLAFDVGEVRIDLDTTSGLELTAGGIGVDDGSGLTRVGAGGLRVDLESPGVGAGGLEFAAGQVAIDLGTNSGLALTASGLEITDGSGLVATGGSLAVDLEAAGVGTGGLSFDAGEIRIDLATAPGGLALTATGITIDDTFMTAHWVMRHTPTGNIDSTVTDYTITDGTPVQDGTNGMESLYLNGVLQAEGDSTTGDYTMGTTTVLTIHTPPESGDIIRISYPKQLGT